ncbi:hypothetical protein AAF712_015413 [Marasmius tenuissimus]|uniref:Uncharacterized protein n=1 Tax=Marasmius tenuissimus TaxID=585030 RepID=A0ABR2Z8K6_9AGAR
MFRTLPPRASSSTSLPRNGLLASEDEPRFLICNDNTQKETPYKTANIVGVIEKA